MAATPSRNTKQARTGARQEIDEEVDVAVGPHVTARSRAEDGQLLHLVAAADVSDLGFGKLDAGSDGHAVRSIVPLSV